MDVEFRDTNNKKRKFGYARGKGEALKEQIKALEENGCDFIYIDEE